MHDNLHNKDVLIAVFRITKNMQFLLAVLDLDTQFKISLHFFEHCFFIYLTGKCLPEGLVDVTDCYYGFPIALSYPHFLDAEPSLLEKVTGMSPNRSLHESFFILNPVSIHLPMF